MNILVVGDGAREHAILWKLKRDLPKANLYCAPGNGGIENVAHCVPISVLDTDKLLKLAGNKKVDLTIIVDDLAIINGTADEFRNQGLNTIGPSEQAVRLIARKTFTKYLLDKYNVPTAKYKEFKYYRHAIDYIKKYEWPLVIKPDEFSENENTVISDNVEEANYFIKKYLLGKEDEKNKQKIILEEFLVGQEISVSLFTDGMTYRVITPVCPYKSIFDGEVGTITEGMGSYAPIAINIKKGTAELIEDTIIKPLVKGLTLEGIPYRGVLKVGIILTFEGPRVISLKPTFPDPETMVFMPLLRSNLYDLLAACQSCKLDSMNVRLKSKFTTNVVISSSGYPGAYNKGKEIIGLNSKFNDNIFIFHHGTNRNRGNYITSRGRVLSIVSLAKTLAESREKAYKTVKQITFDGAYYRRDIALPTLKLNHQHRKRN